MLYKQNGYLRKYTISVSKGDVVHTYSLLDSFGGNRRIDTQQLRTMSDASYQSRLQDFVSYLGSLHEGLLTDCPNIASQAVEYDTTMCPIQTVDIDDA